MRVRSEPVTTVVRRITFAARVRRRRVHQRACRGHANAVSAQRRRRGHADPLVVGRPLEDHGQIDRDECPAGERQHRTDSVCRVRHDQNSLEPGEDAAANEGNPAAGPDRGWPELRTRRGRSATRLRRRTESAACRGNEHRSPAPDARGQRSRLAQRGLRPGSLNSCHAVARRTMRPPTRIVALESCTRVPG